MFPRLRSFLTTLIQRERFEDSLDEEIRFHLDAQTEDLVRTGVPSAEAVRRARAQFGSIEATKDDCRRARHFGLDLVVGVAVRFGMFRLLPLTPVGRIRPIEAADDGGHTRVGPAPFSKEVLLGLVLTPFTL